MKNKLLVISAVVVIAFIGAPAFSQNSAPANTTSSTAKQTFRPRVKPISPAKETPTKQSSVAQPVNTAKGTNQKFHAHVQPVSAAKQAPVQSTHTTTNTNSVAKPFHAHIKPVTPAKSTSATQTHL